MIIAVCFFAFLSLNKIIGQNSRSEFHYTWLRCAAYMGNTQEAIKCWDGAAGSHSFKLPWHWPMAEEALSKCPLISAHATQRKVPNAISIRVSVWTKARFLLIRRNELVTSWKHCTNLKRKRYKSTYAGGNNESQLNSFVVKQSYIWNLTLWKCYEQWNQ